jgi:putative spermidine/putrescine transport system permease protein
VKQSLRKQLKKYSFIWLLLPMILLYGVFLLGGILQVFLESMGHIPALGMNRISADAYIDIVQESNFLITMSYSLALAILSSSIATITGVLIAYGIHLSKSKHMQVLVKKILQMGLILPYLYMVLLVILSIGKTGFLSRILFQLGFIEGIKEFPELVYHRFGFGIILVFILKGAPFVALFTLNILNEINTGYGEIAKTLGGNNISILLKIYLPFLSESIVWCASILLVYQLGSFEVPFLLGTNEPITLSSKLYSLYIHSDIQTIPKTMAMNIVILIISTITVFLYSVLLKRIMKGGKNHEQNQ